MKNLRWIGTAAAILILLCGVSGCGLLVAGGAAGAGVYSWVKGELARTYDAPMDRALAAARKAAADLKFKETGTETDSLKTVLKYDKQDGTPVTIRVQRLDANRTEVGVRVGYVGVWDKDQAETVQKYIFKAL